jgi:hypothetical protein
MSLLNYTTEVSAEKTIDEVQKCRASNGATAALCKYDEKGKHHHPELQGTNQQAGILPRRPRTGGRYSPCWHESAKCPGIFARLAGTCLEAGIGWHLEKEMIQTGGFHVKIKIIADQLTDHYSSDVGRALDIVRGSQNYFRIPRTFTLVCRRDGGEILKGKRSNQTGSQGRGFGFTSDTLAACS